MQNRVDNIKTKKKQAMYDAQDETLKGPSERVGERASE